VGSRHVRLAKAAQDCRTPGRWRELLNSSWLCAPHPPQSLPVATSQVILLFMANPDTPWPHAPTHRLSEGGTYFLTVGTYHKEHCFRGAKRLEVLQRGLLTVAHDFGWQLEAWAVFSNH